MSDDVYAQTNVGLLCCVGSGSNVATAWKERMRQARRTDSR